MDVQHAGVLSLICNGNFQFVFPRTRRRGTIARAFSEKPIDAFFVFSPARRHARGFVRVRTGDGVVFEERIVIFKKYTSSVRGRPTSTSDAYVGDARGRRRRTTRAKTRETRTRVAVRGVGTPAGRDADGGQGGVS